MESSNIFSLNKNEFEMAYTFVQTVFKINKRLPEQVFDKDFSSFICEESYFALSNEFWGTIQQLANLFGDEHIIVGVIEPDPDTYFFQEFGYYNWFKFPTNITASAYADILHKEPEDSPADALTYNSEIIIWTSLSRKWAVWMERGYDICILGFTDRDSMIFLNTLIGRWRPPIQALDELIALNFKDQKVPSRFKSIFLANYSEEVTPKG